MGRGGREPQFLREGPGFGLSPATRACFLEVRGRSGQMQAPGLSFQARLALVPGGSGDKCGAALTRGSLTGPLPGPGLSQQPHSSG